MDVEISIESDKWTAHPDMGPFLANATAKTVEIARLPVASDAELSILLADEAVVRDLNRSYRGKDSATNVLSFPQQTAGGEERRLLGDIALAYETVAREAAEADKPFEHHLAHLVIHGLLHLFGYDHDRDETATEMEDTERAVLAALGIPDPYMQNEEHSEPAVLGPAS